MPESESFDAFYARTVWNVTSQMHALAGQDSAADHAIREAYARAYQQWYEIADYPDTESWVLAVAREAYERRRPEAAARQATPTPPGHDSLSWPGLYRPRTPAATPADPAATIDGPLIGMAAAPTVGAAAGPAAAAGGIGLVQGPVAGVTAAPPRADQAPPPAPPGQPRTRRRIDRPSSRRNLIALTAAIALIVAAGVIYLVTAPSPARQAAQHKTSTKNQGAVMLGAGKTGKLSAIPWGLVKAAWTLAEVSGGPAGTNQPGTITTYLVDPLGGRYQIKSWSPSVTPQLLGWSGNGMHALYAVPNDSASGSATYQLLSLQTGEMASLPLPAGVTAVGFTRPDGLAIVAVKQNPDAFKLQRYDLQGNFQATIGSLPRKPGSPDWLPGCGTECGALSSPNGDTDVWGVTGDQMQVVGNADGKVTKLSVPGGASCVPLAWRDDTTVLAWCSVAGQPSAGQLWLVPSDSSTAPTQLTQTSGSPSGSGDLTGAWQTAGTTYATVTNFNQCQGVPSGPGGLAVVPVGSDGSLQQPISVQRPATNNHTSIVSATGGKLLVLAQTSCPGTSSLLRLNPSTGATTTLLAGQAGQVGVLAAVPFGGLAPTATNGQ
jgi:hypothetical protein